MAVKKKISTDKIAKVGKKQVVGFWEFIRSQGVMGLAIGLVLGGAVTDIVKSLIDNIIMPPIGFLLGSADGLKGLKLNLGNATNGGQAVLTYGSFLNDFINFCVIALIIYLIVKTLKVDIKK
jgi:large conductance mechanosensitive channel